MRRLLPIVADVHEPEAIVTGLDKTLDVYREANEPKGFADYYWNNGLIIMRERKQAFELLSEIGGILDVQLVKYHDKHPDAEVGIIQEGLITPGPNDSCQVWKLVKPGNRKDPILVKASWPKKMKHRGYSSYLAWVYQRALEGITLYVTFSMEDTVELISAHVYNSMKSEHIGLAREVVIKAKRTDPFRAHLQSIRGIGQRSVIRLLEGGRTPWELYSLDFKELVFLEGERVAAAIFNGIGKSIPN